MKRKRSTPFPKRILRHNEYYYFVKQKRGKGTYKIDSKVKYSYPNLDKDKYPDVIKVWKEDALRMAA